MNVASVGNNESNRFHLNGLSKTAFVFLIVSVISLCFSMSEKLIGSESASPETASVQSDKTPPADKSDTSASEEETSDRKILKLIPDLKFLQGSPEVLFDLGHMFTDSGEMEDDGIRVFSIIYNKKEKVVKATIVDGTQLKLESKKLGKSEIVIEAKNGTQCVHTKFKCEVWQPDYWKLVMTVIGGLGIFLLGMNYLSEGLQSFAGNSLRRMISTVTSNRLMAIGIGTLVTTFVQSSSITTVMVVGLVNSGFMTLTQSIGVIMGANIGTTITGWILVLKIGKYGLPIVGVGAFIYLFSKRERLRYIAIAAMGLGMVFLGLELMKDGFAIIKVLPEFEAWFEKFDASTYLGVLQCAAVGCILTFIVQSSSATLVITIGLAQIGVIPFETAAALVMGENVGTTITAWLASLGASTNAKRAAYFHVVFNLIGVMWITAIFQSYIMLIRYITIGDSAGEISSTTMTTAIATTHTLFNVTNTLLFLPFAHHFARLLVRFVPEKQNIKEETHLTNLDVRMLETPVIAVEQARLELLTMADGCNKMMGCLKKILTEKQPDETLMQEVLDLENHLDQSQVEIVEFVSNLLSSHVPHDVTDEIRRQLRMTDEYESVSDSIATVMKSYRKLKRRDLKFPEHEYASILELHEMVAEYLTTVTEAYRNHKHDILTYARPQGILITKHIKKLGNEIIDKALVAGPDDRLDARIVSAYNRQITAYRRIRAHVLNIAEAIDGEK